MGVSGNEGASLEFVVKHTGTISGTKLVNDSITYADTEGNAVTFPEPSIKVDCGLTVTPEPCPIPIDLATASCQDSLVVDLGDTYLESLGRILQLNVTLKNVCPYKRVALAVILTEVDYAGQEHSRGMKTFTIPAHSSPGCRDILVKCIKFVLPEGLNVSGKCPQSLCSIRNFKARLIAHKMRKDHSVPVKNPAASYGASNLLRSRAAGYLTLAAVAKWTCKHVRLARCSLE